MRRRTRARAAGQVCRRCWTRSSQAVRSPRSPRFAPGTGPGEPPAAG
ncbi:zinc finger domain-containing protein [Streptosporangium saharense]